MATVDFAALTASAADKNVVFEGERQSLAERLAVLKTHLNKWALVNIMAENEVPANALFTLVDWAFEDAPIGGECEVQIEECWTPDTDETFDVEFGGSINAGYSDEGRLSDTDFDDFLTDKDGVFSVAKAYEWAASNPTI